MILHVDLNSFFARVEQQTHPSYRNRPIGILGKGHKGARTCVCAASPEAKKFGVKSGCSTYEARRLCPKIILVPPDYPKYLDVSRQFMTILHDTSPWVEIFSIDEAFIRVDGELDIAITVAQDIKTRLKQELGELITVSIGIAWGKVFAKLAGELHKPDGLVILDPTSWRNQVGELPVAEICGIGYRLSNHLQLLGVTTINDLHQADAGLLVARFGPSTGMHLWQIGQGIDLSPVISSQNLPTPQSIGHQITLDRDVRLDQLYPILMKLTQKVGRRLRRAGLAARNISLHFSLEIGGYWSGNRLHPTGIMTDPELNERIRQVWQSAPLPAGNLIRRVGVVTSHLLPIKLLTQPLFMDHKINELVTYSLDAIRDRYGDSAIEWGSGFATELGNLRDWRGPRAVLDI